MSAFVCICVTNRTVEAGISDAGGRAVYGVGLLQLTCWDCGFESRLEHRCLSVVRVVCCAGRGLCDGPIPRPGESCLVCMCVSERDQAQE